MDGELKYLQCILMREQIKELRKPWWRKFNLGNVAALLGVAVALAGLYLEGKYTRQQFGIVNEEAKQNRGEVKGLREQTKELISRGEEVYTEDYLSSAWGGYEQFKKDGSQGVRSSNLRVPTI